jgi:hypothetical protein
MVEFADSGMESMLMRSKAETWWERQGFIIHVALGKREKQFFQPVPCIYTLSISIRSSEFHHRLMVDNSGGETRFVASADP